MRLASYSVEDFFNRAKAMDMDKWTDGKPLLEEFIKLNQSFR